MQNTVSRIVVLGTGGTLAGTASDPCDSVGYQAGRIGIATLVERIPALAGVVLQTEQVAQLDSKDMCHAVWRRLATRVAHHLERRTVTGIVVTHGTDTLEETAYLLQRVLAPVKPVVITAAMRPATALLSDGPQNLLDAVTLARDGRIIGVCAVIAGRAWAGSELRKQHSHRLDAFDAGDAGALAVIEAGQIQQWRTTAPTVALGLPLIARHAAAWPRVEIVVNHAGANGAVVDALLAQGVDGLVVAGTGNGTLSVELEAALRRAVAAGVTVLRTSRCANGGVLGHADSELPNAGSLTAFQARVELLLRLLAAAGSGM